MKDKYGRKIDYMRISVIEKCNYRCFYCMPQNENCVKQESKNLSKKILSKDEIIKLVKAGAALGIKKVRITGGEPFVRNDTEDILKEISLVKGIEDICLTTNGSVLYEKIDLLKQCKVTKINVSIDTLDPIKFRKITKYGDLERVMLGVKKAIQNGIQVKINSVIVKEINQNEIVNLASLTKIYPVDVRFIELMPIGEGKKYSGFSGKELRDIILSKEKILNLNVKDGTAEYFKLIDAKGKIGFINPLSNCFCEDCNKIRITSKGELKQCLNKKSNLNIAELMRLGYKDNVLLDLIADQIYNKPEKHLFNSTNNYEEEYNMNKIGG